MSETSQFVSNIKVRALITAFEQKVAASTNNFQYSRLRANSVGNLLAKDVLVQTVEYNTLEDIQQALYKVETDLNYYKGYNKAKHVAFQERLFILLTSIVNIVNGDSAPLLKKQLVSKTQTLVSFLNQKLPSNTEQNKSNQYNEINKYKYTTYGNYIKETKEEDLALKKVENSDINNNNKEQDEVIVSVQKLKQNFLLKEESKPVNSRSDTNSNEQNETIIANIAKEKPSMTYAFQEIDINSVDEPDIVSSVSVSKLRNVFEGNTPKAPEGLGLRARKTDKPDSLSSASNLSFPYTERNLGNVRLQRTISGNYLTYSGLLQNADLHRSKSDDGVGVQNRIENLGERVTEYEKNYVKNKDFDYDSESIESDSSLETVEELAGVNGVDKVVETDVRNLIANFEDLKDNSTENFKNSTKDLKKINIQNENEVERAIKIAKGITIDKNKDEHQAVCAYNIEDVDKNFQNASVNIDMDKKEIRYESVINGFDKDSIKLDIKDDNNSENYVKLNLGNEEILLKAEEIEKAEDEFEKLLRSDDKDT